MQRLLFLSVVTSVLGAVTVKDCSAGSSFFKIQSLSFSPDTPVGGQNGTLHSVYEVPMTVAAGTTKYSCSLNGLPVYSETFDLCSQTACPITGGVHDDYSTSEVPAVSGKVSCTIDWRDTAGSQLLCIQTIMNVASSEKQTLRGSTLGRCRMNFAPLLATNLSENVTFAPLEGFDPAAEYHADPVEPEMFEDDPDAPPHYHTYADHAKKSLMILRSGRLPPPPLQY
jgi:hypothetical protein